MCFGENITDTAATECRYFKNCHTWMDFNVIYRRYCYFTSEFIREQLYDRLRTEQCGQTKPLMFSTIPRMRMPVFLQKVISLLTSPVDTACSQHMKAENTYLLKMFVIILVAFKV